MPLNTIIIRLDRHKKIYVQGEYLTGTLSIENKYDLKHEDTFQVTNKTIPIVNCVQELRKGGRLAPGKTEIPFRLSLEGNLDFPILYETYHGVFINIQYCVKCRIRQSVFFKDLLKFNEFMVQYHANPIGAPPNSRQPIKFEITPDSLSNARTDIIPQFKITGQLDSTIYLLMEPLTGEFKIEKCDAIIRSVELQLVRVETRGVSPGDRDYSRDATEVQNIQIADGNLLRNIPIDIHMVLPRLFTCPTLITSDFKIEFEINLVIIFDDNYLITENFPIKLVRSTLQPINLA